MHAYPHYTHSYITIYYFHFQLDPSMQFALSYSSTNLKAPYISIKLSSVCSIALHEKPVGESFATVLPWIMNPRMVRLLICPCNVCYKCDVAQ